MRIVYIHQYFNTLEMAGGTRSFEMARRLVARGHEVHVITSWRDPAEATDWFVTREEGIEVHWLPVTYSNHMGNRDRIKAFIRFASKASSRAMSIPSDVIFATSTPLTVAIPAIAASIRRRTPMVFEVRDLWPTLPIAIGALRNPLLKIAARLLEKTAYTRAAAVVALSPGMKDGVVQRNISPEKVVVIPNSCDNDDHANSEAGGLAFRADRPWLAHRPLLVYCGTFGKINGIHTLVEIAAELLRISPETRVLLVGAGQEETNLRTRARANGTLDRNLFIEPSIPKRDVPALLAASTMACSFFVDLPEMRANSANKFFDGLAASRPMVINHGGWMADLLSTTGAGLVVWQLSPREAARKIAAALHDAEWLANARQAAKRLATKDFDRDRLAGDLEQVLIAAAGNNRSAA
ncbi:glycosyltransferase family 4 protein [Pigmentiphaga litoralis]|uniref:Glycosyltransferase involved in cell wall biosynthesis n=1 Tax=Pigmentiphaga litoralis TaxID=516702 RepID=A0A7Y9ISF5_9BURK|nr:glycosyltransferase family 4 protein [Pigmentiphaga litoralis]NYE24189.1 glycosyltransferase involved in cell wall biosynthesis [Pigmentiphaga litoralis]NYE82197.1 glycosyltransferase involved in cell wall biosynthesis [Pigmentiphaga litoralis]